MDLLGFKKRKKERDFNNEVNLAIGAELERFGFANAEHFKSHADLSKVAGSKINPQFAKNNYHQQAGFSAEIKTEARTNAENIINKKNTRIRRTDNIGEVNHPQYDHVEVDSKGNPILNEDGTFKGGSQQKVHNSVDKYDKYSKPELFEKYKDTPIDVPSDQIDDIQDRYTKNIEKLKQQEESLRKQGKTELADEKKAEIKRNENVKKRFRDSGVSTDEAMEARKHHNISVAKDIAKISHKAGVDSAKMGAALGGGISTFRNMRSYINGDKDGMDAVKDVAKDTTKSAAISYASGATSTAIGGALKASSSQVAKNLAKGNTPTVILQTGVILAKQTTKLLTGKITGEEFAKNIGQEGTTLATSLTGANLGAVLGTAIAPGVGTIVGGVIGGMTASLMSSALYSELQKSLHDTEISNQQREMINKYCQELIKQEKEYREYAMSVYDDYFDRKELELKDGFKTISIAIQNGENINHGLAMVGEAFDLELKFANVDDFKQHIKSGKTLKL